MSLNAVTDFFRPMKFDLKQKMRRDVSLTEEDLFWRPTKNLVNKIEAGWIERHAEAEVEVEEDGEEEESLRRQVNLLQLLRLPLLSR